MSFLDSSDSLHRFFLSLYFDIVNGAHEPLGVERCKAARNTKSDSMRLLAGRICFSPFPKGSFPFGQGLLELFIGHRRITPIKKCSCRASENKDHNARDLPWLHNNRTLHILIFLTRMSKKVFRWSAYIQNSHAQDVNSVCSANHRVMQRHCPSFVHPPFPANGEIVRQAPKAVVRTYLLLGT